MGLEQEREEVKKIYKTLYSDDRHYGRMNWANGAYDFIKGLNISSLLDVGCGKNYFVRWAREQGIRATGTDIACNWSDVVCPAHNLPFENKSFDYVMSFDMLEHLLPKEIDEVLEEFFRVSSKGFLFSIAYKESSETVEGKQIHLTVQPEEWWIKKIKQYGEVENFTLRAAVKDRKGNVRKYRDHPYIHCVFKEIL